jgi:hypothetical protein
MVAMLIGCGLRRAELLAVRLESIQQRVDELVRLLRVLRPRYRRGKHPPAIGEGRNILGGCVVQTE